MLIRKKFKFEAAHRVRSSTGSRCKNTVHGHSYICEVLLKGPDDIDMVMDFGDLKNEIGFFMDSLDHATFIWDGDDPDYIVAMSTFSKRIIRMKQDTTAENMAKAIFNKITTLLLLKRCMVSGVIVHETATGYAQANTCNELEDIITVRHPNDD